MDNSPRIPRPNQNAASSRNSGPTLPPAGSVVMASVEENLGEGLYALKWNGNRFAVTSQAVLQPGQSLILKSERSPEGKVTLVVQGPALPNPGELIGKPTYTQPEKKTPAEAGGQSQAGEMAAGVGRPGAGASDQPAASLLGLVLEPLDDLLPQVKFLLEEAKREKEEWQKHFSETDGENENAESDGEGEIPPEQAAKQPRPAPAQNTPVTPQPAQPQANGQSTPAQQPEASQPQQAPGQAAPPAAPAQPDQPAPAPQPAQPQQPTQPPPVGSELPPATPQPPVADIPGQTPLPATPPPAVEPRPLPADVQPPLSPEQPAPLPAQGQGQPAIPPVGNEQQPPPAQNVQAVPLPDPGAAAKPLPPQLKPEIFLKEALLQLVKAAELPLVSPAADTQALGVNTKVPEAVADKAAAILLRGAGLTPDPATMQAARALVDNNVPVDRPTVQAMLALAANVPEEERAALIKAVARQAAKDIPLAAPLASGMADVIARKDGVFELVNKSVSALTAEPRLPEIRPLQDAAVEMLELLSVDLDREDAALALERYVSTFGRTALGKASALVETATQTVLERHPVLPKIDTALTAILTLLEPDIRAEEMPQAQAPIQQQPSTQPQAPVQDPPAAQTQAPAGAQPQAQPNATPVQSETVAPQPEPLPQPELRPLPPVGNPYANVAKPFPGLDALQLPPMPKVATLEGAAIPVQSPPVGQASVPTGTPMPPPQAEVVQPQPSMPAPDQPPAPVAPGQPAPEMGAPAPVPEPMPVPAPAMIAPQPDSSANVPVPSQPQAPLPPSAGQQSRPVTEQPVPAQPQPQPGRELTPEQAKALATMTEEEIRARFSPRMDPYLTPGGNRPEVELLKPAGFLDRFLSSGTGQDAKLGRDAEALLRDLLSDNPDKQADALRDLPGKNKALLRETASRLASMEQQLLRADAQLNKLSDAASSLRDLGRQLLAVKAENVAGQERNPQVMLAEVPFKLADNGGEGRMQMFYRRSKSKADSWTSRVILDLNTTVLGPVLGDMRFFGSDMVLNMFVDDQKTADFLAQSGDELAEQLLGKGFRLKSRFMVLPPPPPPPQLDAARPLMEEQQDASNTVFMPRRPGRLDTKA